MMTKTVEVYVATHKQIDFPLPDYCRRIQVNAEANAQWPGYLHDNDNPDNISRKNPYYSELTVLYAMWKNCTADIQGLYHYRRYIMSHKYESKYRYGELACCVGLFAHEVRSIIITPNEISNALKDNDIILLSPFSRYPITNLEAMLLYCGRFINILRKVIRDYWPEYLLPLDNVYERYSMSVCNMFIAGKKVTDEYCEWLFDVLLKVEDLSSQYDDLDPSRAYGYLSEILLNVYADAKKLRVKHFYRAFVLDDERESIPRRIVKHIPYLLPALKVLKLWITQRCHEKTRESENFSVKILKYKGYFHSPLFVAELTPKTDCDIIPALAEILPSLKAEAQNLNYNFVPRVCLTETISDSLRDELYDMGVTIAKH